MSWRNCTLGDICTATQGQQIPKSEQKSLPQDGYRRYLYISDFRHDKNLKFVKDIYPNKIVGKNDLIVSNTGSQGEIFRGVEGILSNNLFKVSYDKKIVSGDYLYYFITSPLFTDYQNRRTRGTTQPHMGHKNFLSTPISLPSLNEQKKIVEKIKKLNETKNFYNEAKNSELANYDKLFETLLNEIFNELTSNFQNLLLKEKTYLAGRIGWKGLSKKDYLEEGPLFINVSSLNYGQYVNFQDSKHISKERYFESENIGLVEGDVLICKDGSIGKVGIVGKLNELATVNSSLLIVRPLEGLLPKYLYYVFISPQFQSIVKSRIEGSTVPHLYQRDIKNFSIPLPPLDVQEKTINKLDSLYKLIEEIKKNVELIKIKNENQFRSTLKKVLSYE